MVLTCCPLYHKILTTRKKTSLLKSSQISRRSNFFKLSLRFFPFLYHNYSRIWQKWWICLSHMKYLILHHWSSYKVPVNAATICSIIVDRTKQWRIPAAQKGARKIAGNVCTCIIVWLNVMCYSYQISESQRISNEVSGAYYIAACKKSRQDVENLQSSGFPHTDVDNLKLDKCCI